jgi:hypothetical protein
MQTANANPIFVKRNLQKQLAADFQVSVSYVSLALRGKRIKDKAEEIRLKALTDYNGLEIALTQEQRSKIY